MVILIRALLAVIIHWEIRMEQKDEELFALKKKNKQDEKSE